MLRGCHRVLRSDEGLADIFDQIFLDIVRRIATALPGGAANAGEVIITPARTTRFLREGS
jgi:hypothetical protein